MGRMVWRRTVRRVDRDLLDYRPKRGRALVPPAPGQWPPLGYCLGYVPIVTRKKVGRFAPAGSVGAPDGRKLEVCEVVIDWRTRDMGGYFSELMDRGWTAKGIALGYRKLACDLRGQKATIRSLWRSRLFAMYWDRRRWRPMNARYVERVVNAHRAGWPLLDGESIETLAERNARHWRERRGGAWKESRHHWEKMRKEPEPCPATISGLWSLPRMQWMPWLGTKDVQRVRISRLPGLCLKKTGCPEKAVVSYARGGGASGTEPSGEG